jgi:ABC-type phosphate/phosphonate transport system substrate-binding protein
LDDNVAGRIRCQTINHIVGAILQEWTMSKWIANARMYAVTPEAEEAWKALLAYVGDEATVPLEYLAYPAPQPLDTLWVRPDLGAVLMCGYPIALGLAPVATIAAPVPSASWAGGRAVYRTDFIVKADGPFQILSDTFGHRLGWTVAHSHSGFNALRYHLLRFRSGAMPVLYREVVGNLITARHVVDAVLNGSIDVGPLDAYWHSILSLHRPEIASQLRIVESTDLIAAPAFIASQQMAPAEIDCLRQAFVNCANKTWFPSIAAAICLSGFEPRTRTDYDAALEWQAEATARGYPTPA